jgi:hypothetical protein
MAGHRTSQASGADPAGVIATLLGIRVIQPSWVSTRGRGPGQSADGPEPPVRASEEVLPRVARCGARARGAAGARRFGRARRGRPASRGGRLPRVRSRAGARPGRPRERRRGGRQWPGRAPPRPRGSQRSPRAGGASGPPGPRRRCRGRVRSRSTLAARCRRDRSLTAPRRRGAAGPLGEVPGQLGAVPPPGASSARCRSSAAARAGGSRSGFAPPRR